MAGPRRTPAAPDRGRTTAMSTADTALPPPSATRDHKDARNDRLFKGVLTFIAILVMFTLAGAGMTLSHPERGTMVPLGPLTPYAFAGDWETSCVLRDGPVRDFNLISRRGRVVGGLPLVWLPPGGLEARATRRAVGHAGFALAAAVVVVLATWWYGISWVGAFGPLARNASDTTSFALPSRLTQLGVPKAVALALAAVAFVVAYAWLARQAWRGHARVALAAGVLLLCAPYVTPWYLAWVVPLAAIEQDRTARLLAPSPAERDAARPASPPHI